MYASLSEPGDRICTAYFVNLVTPDHGASFLADLHAWATDGPYRLLIVADDAAATLEGEAREEVLTTLASAPLCDVIDRIAVSGPATFREEVDVLDQRLPMPVRHFEGDWHGAQTWLRAPIGA